MINCTADNTDPTTAWPTVQAGLVSSGTCKAGYYLAGTPQRPCTQSGNIGVWSPPTSSCLAVNCSALSYSNATWPQTISATLATGTCDPGYYSPAPMLACNQNQSTASWSTVVVSPCQPVYCPAGNNTNATWVQAISATNVSWSCNVGYYSSDPVTPCTQSENTAFWEDPNVPCLAVYCSVNTSAEATFPQTISGTNATGTCLRGYAGVISRYCNQTGPTASWADTITGQCQFIPTPPPIPPSGSPQVEAIFHILGVNFQWYSLGINQDVFAKAFGDWIAALCAVNPLAVNIVSVVQGSVIVDFTVLTLNQTALAAQLTAAINNPSLNMTILNNELPSAAFDTAGVLATLDPTQSFVVNTSTAAANTGAIAGGVVGGLLGLALVVGLAVFFYIRRRKQDAEAGKTESVEMMARGEEEEEPLPKRRRDKGKQKATDEIEMDL